MPRTFAEFFGSLPGRIGLGLAAMGAVAVSIPIAENSAFSFEKALAVATAISVWLWSEVGSHKNEPFPHDVELCSKLRSLLSDNIGFAREHDFGNSFREDNIGGFITYYDTWKGSDHSFLDRKLDKRLKHLHVLIRNFVELLGDGCGELPGKPGLLSVKTELDRRNGFRSEETVKVAESLNSTADGMVKNWDQLITESLTRLRVTL